MQVLFLKNVKGLGKAGEVKEVNDGYARNFLFPQKVAEPATDGKVNKLKKDAQAKIDEAQVHVDLLLKTFSSLSDKEIELHRKVNSAGALFGGVHTSDIREAIQATHRVSVGLEYIKIPEIKTTGEFVAKIGDKHKLGKEFVLKVKVIGQ